MTPLVEPFPQFPPSAPQPQKQNSHSFFSSPGKVSEGWQGRHHPRVCLWNSCFLTYAVTPSRFQYTTMNSLSHIFSLLKIQRKSKLLIFSKKVNKFLMYHRNFGELQSTLDMLNGFATVRNTEGANENITW